MATMVNSKIKDLWEEYSTEEVAPVVLVMEALTKELKEKEEDSKEATVDSLTI